MTKEELITKLNGDLTNEYTHMHFYLHSSFMIEGLHRAELGEWLAEQASSEFKHIQEFAKMIVGLGSTPICSFKSFPTFTHPVDILKFAYKMEEEVVKNYVKRREECENMARKQFESSIDGTWVGLFLEDQIMDSRSDLDEISQLLKGIQ
jgi:bacterioferritin (cytochrome b1)